MTHSSENGNGSSRLDRLEAIMLDLAGATVRHDNEFSRIKQTLDELASAAVKHDEEFSRINQTIDRLVAQQREADERYEQRFRNLTEQGELNREQISSLTASIQELRNLVADYIQGRNQA